MSDTYLRPEIEPRLQHVSDTDILLNFAAALEVLYPFMRAVCAHCYDPYDDVVEPLYYALVFGSFSGKYGVAVPGGMCHVYEMGLESYAAIHHVRVVPRQFPLQVQSQGERRSIPESDLVGRDLVFLNFGDGTHSLTSPQSPDASYDPSFRFTRFTLVHAASRSPVAHQATLWVLNSDVDYEFLHASGGPRGSS